jgi:inosine-uridine nucleoside N-ribohydrolase
MEGYWARCESHNTFTCHVLTITQDAYALLLSAHDPRVELLGVSTVHGNAALDQTTFNTRAILEAIGRRDVKVYPGAAKPIVRDVVHAADIHGTMRSYVLKAAD